MRRDDRRHAVKVKRKVHADGPRTVKDGREREEPEKSERSHG
jgi:hypothetical protein